MPIQDVNLSVGNGAADRDCSFTAGDLVGRRPDGCLRWAVHVENMARNLQFLDEGGRQSFAAQEEFAQRAQSALRLWILEQHSGQRGGTLEMSDAMPHQLFGHCIIAATFFGGSVVFPGAKSPIITLNHDLEAAG